MDIAITIELPKDEAFSALLKAIRRSLRQNEPTLGEGRQIPAKSAFFAVFGVVECY